METANWESYRRQVKDRLQGENPNIVMFTSTIREAAIQNIKKTTGKPPKKAIDG
jgi:hypothetical protein